MTRYTKPAMLSGISALLLGATSLGVHAQDQAALRAEVAQLRNEMAEIRRAQGEDWLTQRRAEEVKGLIREVLNDADTRASLMDDGVIAGHDGKNFFLKSADDNFLLEVSGQFQFRYIVGMDGDNSDTDGEVTSTNKGFQARRLKVGFSGHAFTPKFTYKFVIASDRDGGEAEFADDAYIQYELFEDFAVRAGNQKIPFLREELLSSSRQLAVDRSSVTEYFTQNRGLGVNFIYDGLEAVRLQGGFFSGANNNFEDFNDPNQADVNVTARADAKLFGDWAAAKDYNAWEGTETSLFVGGAASYQSGGLSSSNRSDNVYLGWTLDALFKSGPVSVNAAYMGANLDESGQTPQGVLLQGGVFVIPDKWQPFVRYEYLDQDSNADAINIATVGFNYYFHKHALKFTADVVYVFSGDFNDGIAPFGASAFSDSLGYNGFTGENQALLRTQLQFQF